jgi:hypothetical protein
MISMALRLIGESKLNVAAAVARPARADVPVEET